MNESLSPGYKHPQLSCCKAQPEFASLVGQGTRIWTLPFHEPTMVEQWFLLFWGGWYTFCTSEPEIELVVIRLENLTT